MTRQCSFSCAEIDNLDDTVIILSDEIARLRAENERLRNENDSMRSRGLDRAFDALCVKDDDRGRLIAAIHREHAEVVRLRAAGEGEK